MVGSHLLGQPSTPPRSNPVTRKVHRQYIIHVKLSPIVAFLDHMTAILKSFIVKGVSSLLKTYGVCLVNFCPKS